MTKPENKGFVPALRFPEFRNAADWEIKLFDELFTIGSGKAYKHLSSGDIPVYGSGGYMLSVNDYLHDGESVCIGRKGTINNPMFLTGKFWTVDTLFYTHSFQECVPKFIYAIFQSIDWLKHNEAGGVPSLSKANIEKIEVIVPKPTEQQKIADFLTSIDDLITIQAQKLNTLQAYKKGLMQQLFPAFGETVPKLRFLEFQDTGEWEEKTIGQVAKYENGKAHEQEISEIGQYIVVNSKFISSDGEVKKFTNSGNCLANKNDILMVLSDVPNGKAIAKCLIVDADKKYTVNQRICKLTPTKVQSKILFYSINRNQYFLNFDDGVKQTNLKNEDVLNCPILLPENPLEQQKIADFLTSIDDLLTAHTQKLKALKTHKKGLMQKLLPAIIEVNQ